MTATTRIALLTGMTGLVVVASACGGASKPSVASIGTTAATTHASTGQRSAPSNPADGPSTFARWVAYNACLTDHGMPSTTPKNGGSLLNGDSTPSAQAAAEKACQKLLPPGSTPQRLTETQMKAWLTYAACMRKRGVPSYPDPKFVDNDTGVILDPGGVVDYHSPLVQAALAACKGTFPLPKLNH
jgi:hypothetical protein